MKSNILLLFVFGLSFVTGNVCSGQTNPIDPNPREAKRQITTAFAIRAVIEAQRDAWNRGDIEGYMAGYERSPTTVFISGDNLTRGWQTVPGSTLSCRLWRWTAQSSRSGNFRQKN